MEIIIVDDYEKLSLKAAEIIEAQINKKADSVLGLATGSSPIGTYQKLISDYQDGKVSFCNATSVNLDEYIGLPGTHDQSYRYFMNNQLFDSIDLPIERTHVPNGMAEDEAGEGARYDKLIESLGGIDLQLLGIGNNGHIGFNEPDSVFSTGTHIVKLTESTREANARFFEDPAKVPTEAITMGIKSIMSAKSILLLASGDAKAEALKATINGPIDPMVPASILQLHHNVIIIADKAAASLL